MRFLVVADIHYALKQFDWLLRVAPKYDVVVIAGDLLEMSSMVDRRAQIVVLRTYLSKLTQLTHLVICSGNHDLDAENEHGERIAGWMTDLDELDLIADGSSKLVEGVRFSSLGWWDGPQTKQAVEAQFERDSALEHDAWVWVYHAPPADSPVSWAGSRHYGDPDLVNWINRFHPTLVLSGHVHQSPFIPNGSWVDRVDRSWVFNTGQQPGDLPSHIAFDLETQEAIWLSMAGVQRISLTGEEREPARVTEIPEWITI